MPIKRRKLPEVNELVIGTVKKIFEHGAFVTLDEYNNIEAYCPLNEVTRSWFRNIREVLKVGQKAVFKVIRVDRRKMHVDISLKRVSDDERKEKMKEWKRAVHAEKLLELAAKKLRKTLKEAYREAGWKLEDTYGEIYKALEDSVRYGMEIFTKAGIPEKWAKALYEVAVKHIELSKVKISGIAVLQSYDAKGIVLIRDALLKGIKEARKVPEISIKVYTIGAPRYKVDVEAYDYKAAEKGLQKFIETIEALAKQNNCKFSFKRIKK